MELVIPVNCPHSAHAMPLLTIIFIRLAFPFLIKKRQALNLEEGHREQGTLFPPETERTLLGSGGIHKASLSLWLGRQRRDPQVSQDAPSSDSCPGLPTTCSVQPEHRLCPNPAEKAADKHTGTQLGHRHRAVHGHLPPSLLFLALKLRPCGPQLLFRNFPAQRLLLHDPWLLPEFSSPEHAAPPDIQALLVSTHLKCSLIQKRLVHQSLLEAAGKSSPGSAGPSTVIPITSAPLPPAHGPIPGKQMDSLPHTPTQDFPPAGLCSCEVLPIV